MKMSIKEIATCLVFLVWILICAVSSIGAFGLKSVLAGFGMGVFIVTIMAITVWAWDTFFDKYPTHYGADPP